MAAAQRGTATRIIIAAHQTEVMARQKKLKDLDQYLKPLRRRAGRRTDQSAAVAALLEGRAARGKRPAKTKEG